MDTNDLHLVENAGVGVPLINAMVKLREQQQLVFLSESGRAGEFLCSFRVQAS